MSPTTQNSEDRLTKFAVTADPDDPDEISFIQGEILDILDKQGKWWLIQNEGGSVGSTSIPSEFHQDANFLFAVASSDYFSVFDGGDLQTETRRSSAGQPVYPCTWLPSWSYVEEAKSTYQTAPLKMGNHSAKRRFSTLSKSKSNGGKLGSLPDPQVVRISSFK